MFIPNYLIHHYQYKKILFSAALKKCSFEFRDTLKPVLITCYFCEVVQLA